MGRRRSYGDHVVTIFPGGPADASMTKWCWCRRTSKVCRFASRCRQTAGRRPGGR